MCWLHVADGVASLEESTCQPQDTGMPSTDWWEGDGEPLLISVPTSLNIEW